MVLGTHESLTYFKPKDFLSIGHRRQDKTLKQQLKSGVHALDINLQFDDNNDVLIVSKNKKYTSGFVFSPTDFVNIILDNIHLYRSDDEPIYIKITLVCDKVNLDQELNFIKLCKIFKRKIKQKDNIILCDGSRTCDDERVVVTLPYITYVEPVAEKNILDSRWYEKIIPRLYAKRKNEENKKIWESEDIVVFFDFI